MWPADRGAGMLVALQPVQAEAPVAVGRVVWPAGHGEHVAEDSACVTAENFPAAQLEHFLVDPSLYLPATHGVQVEAHDAGRAVVPLASRAAGSPHRMQEDEPATLPVPGGQAWHAVLPLRPENLPAVHWTQDVPDTMVPGVHALHVVVVPPVENCSGAGHWVQTPSALLYWPEGQMADRVGDGIMTMMVVVIISRNKGLRGRSFARRAIHSSIFLHVYTSGQRLVHGALRWAGTPAAACG